MLFRPISVNRFLFVPSILEIFKSIILCCSLKESKIICPPLKVILFEVIFNEINDIVFFIASINISIP